MKVTQRHRYEKVILAIELIGFGAIVAVTWLDEYADFPHRFFGAASSAIRPEAAIFASAVALVVGLAVFGATLWAFRELRQLQEFIRICSWCRKVRVEGEWISFEQYLKHAHDVRSSHGICPTCRAEASKSRPSGSIAR